MAEIKLKKILSKGNVSATIANLVETIGCSFYIEDHKGTPLIDMGGKEQPNRLPVELEGNIIGWVKGDDRALPLASLLNRLAVAEYEKKILARESLDKYREINLLYTVSEKISTCLDLEEIASLVIREVERLMTGSSAKETATTCGALFLLNNNSGRLDFFQGFGNVNYPNMSFAPGEGIVDDIVLTGEGEIINDVQSDPRFTKGTHDLRSILCVPLKTKNQIIGCICVGSLELANYSSEHKKRLNMLALYTASAIENAQLYNSLEQKVKERTSELAAKNKQILDSIDYAKNIQTAILPHRKKMKEALPKHFVIYKPKDVISGDIYWFHQWEDKVYIAAIDCTGHGVPGALLSMIGDSFLNKLVKERQLSDPALILRHLHNEVRHGLKQGESSDSLDGMDVALCVIEKNKKKITFAGARRPLYIVRFIPDDANPQNKEAEFIVIKGDKKSIGGRQREKERIFTSKEIEVEDGDMIYLTTDGFVDQNNKEGQKYSSQRLRAFLPMLAKLPLDRQENYFEQELMNFMGEEEQRDDITVIGVRL